MAIYVKNNTGVNKVWVGQMIAPSAYHFVEEENFHLWGEDNDFRSAIISGDAVLATFDDGNEDITDPTEASTVALSNRFPIYQTFEFHDDGNKVTDSYLKIAGGITGNDTEYIIPHTAHISSITFSNKNDLSDIDLEVRKNDAIIHTWEIRDAKKAVKTFNFNGVLFNTLDGLSIFLTQAGTVDPGSVVVHVVMAYRELRKSEIVSGT